MKNALVVAAALVVLGGLQALAQPRMFSVVQTSPNETNSFRVEAFESLKIVSAFEGFNSSGRVTIQKGLGTIKLESAFFNAAVMNNTYWTYGPISLPFVVSGPAEVAVTSGSGPRTGATPHVVTFEVGPEAYPVTNTFAIGPASGAQVTLQNSTNLVNWTPATNGFYTNVSENVMFFRIKAERVR